MFDETNTEKISPKTFPGCNTCQEAQRMYVELLGWANSRPPTDKKLVAEIICRFKSNTPGDGVNIIGKLYSRQSANNPRPWMVSPPVVMVKCPVIK